MPPTCRAWRCRSSNFVGMTLFSSTFGGKEPAVILGAEIIE